MFQKNADQLFSRENMLIRTPRELDTRETVITIGSCLARNIEESMRGVGFDLSMLSFAVPKAELDKARLNGIHNRYTPFSVRQLVEWMFGALEDFAKAASTIRKHGDGILAALGLKINNARESPIYPAGLRLLTPSLVQMPTTSV